MTETRKKFQIFTIGHSTRSLKEFLALLKERDITCLVDVRTIPRSRHNPQFNQPMLRRKLPKDGIRYQHMFGLGGLRHTRPDSINTAWRNASFRGFADYMQRRDFVKNLQPLIRLSKRERVAIMCAEAVPWRCHRSLIADALTVRGWEVQHIMSLKNAHPHKLTPWLKAKGTKVWYPAEKTNRSSNPKYTKEIIPMSREFKTGDHVGWNSETGHVRGTIKKKITTPITFKGSTVHASKEEPQYLIKGDKTDHMAMHKGSGLKKIIQSKSRRAL